MSKCDEVEKALERQVEASGKMAAACEGVLDSLAVIEVNAAQARQAMVRFLDELAQSLERIQKVHSGVKE